MKISTRKCSFDGCPRPHHAGGLCHSHDVQRRNGKGLTLISFQRDVPCSVEPCADVAAAKGLCKRHYAKEYARARREGTAHQCRSCDTGVAYGKSAMCDECKKRERYTASLSRPAALNSAHRSNRPECEVPECDRGVAANTIKTGTLASRLCTRHSADASSKTVGVDAYLAVMAGGVCEACGGKDRLVVDHRHGHHDHHAKMCPECIRGRLCSDCNSALGLLGESEERIEGILEYIRRF